VVRLPRVFKIVPGFYVDLDNGLQDPDSVRFPVPPDVFVMPSYPLKVA
jgi:hypothetical protein